MDLRVKSQYGGRRARWASQPHRVLRAVAAAIVLAAGASIGGCGGEEDAQPPPRADERPAATEPAVDDAAVVKPVAVSKPTEPLEEGASCVNEACHAYMAASTSIHPVIEEENCDVCHLPDQGGHVYPLKREAGAMCTECHEIGGRMAVQHMAPDVGDCIVCHEPHASNTAFQLREASVQALCANCHVETPGVVGHEPYAVGACMSCHEPHESNFDGLLRGGEGAEHCFLCHDETKRALEEAPFVHQPSTGDCMICHDPHASDYAHVLTEPIEENCFRCHANIEQDVRGAPAPHDAVFTGERCASCHDSHASGRADLIRDREDKLCLQCHDEPVKARDGTMIEDIGDTLEGREFLHGPIRDGQCSPCHNVHGASHSRLLNERFTEAFYAPFDLKNYALCFDCHVQNLVQDEEATALTDFRDDGRNLHFVHVNRAEKGRTCRTCHEIHGSNLPRHIAESVPFEGSGWALPIRFRKLENGGSCAPGCHEPMTYTRTPIDADEPAGEPEGGAP